MHEATQRGDLQVVIWGTGTPLREFLHVDDLADALLLLMHRYSNEAIINVGSGQELSIAALARMIADIVGFRGELVFDSSKPDGTPRKRLSTERMDALGWRPSVALREGLTHAWRDWLARESQDALAKAAPSDAGTSATR